MDESVRAIQRLNFEYARLIDAGDFESFAALFAHGTWNGEDRPEEIVAWLRRWVILYEGVPRTHHAVQNLDIEVAGDGTATSRCVITVSQLSPRRTDIAVIAINDYSDSYRQLDGEWVWTDRTIHRRLSGDTSMHRTGPPGW